MHAMILFMLLQNSCLDFVQNEYGKHWEKQESIDDYSMCVHGMTQKELFEVYNETPKVL